MTPAPPVPFVIVADLRTGSTLLHSTLDRHPDARCYGELLHPDDLPDNRPGDVARRELSGAELIDRALGAPDVRASGFRAMVFLPRPSDPGWSDAWPVLAEREGLRVLYLTRRDRLAQYASLLVAEATRVYHPHGDDHPVLEPDNRPRVTVDPAEFRRWTVERDALMRGRRDLLRGKRSLELDYETLTGDWDGAMARVQRFLDLPPRPLEPAKRKQETRPLHEVIDNYEELVG